MVLRIHGTADLTSLARRSKAGTAVVWSAALNVFAPELRLNRLRPRKHVPRVDVGARSHGPPWSGGLHPREPIKPIEGRLRSDRAQLRQVGSPLAAPTQGRRHASLGSPPPETPVNAAIGGGVLGGFLACKGDGEPGAKRVCPDLQHVLDFAEKLK